MPRRFSLAFLTVSDVGPLEAIRIARDTGYDQIGLRFLPAGPSEPNYPILTDTTVQRAVSDELAATGVALADIEIVRLGPATDVQAFEPFCALGQKLGARHILVAGDDPDVARMTDTFARFCELAAPFGLTADLEFMPWTAVRSLVAARRIVEDAGQANGGVLIDALHFDRCDSTLDDIRALPKSMIHYAQICDGPVPYDTDDAGLIAVARGARLLPGDGGIDVAGIVAALPPDTVLSIEIPRLALVSSVSAQTRAREAIEATRAIPGV